MFFHNRLFFILLLSPLTVLSQSTAPSGKTVSLTCKIIDMPANADSLTLFTGGGMAKKAVARAGYNADSNFVFSLPATAQPQFYSVGVSDLAAGKVLLGTEPNVTLWANAQYMEKARTVNSPVNKQYEQVIRRCADFSLLENQLQADYQTSDDAGRKKITSEAQALGRSKKQYLDSLKKANTLLWRTATLGIQPEYIGDNNGRYQGMVDFWGKEGFKFVNWTDKGYSEQPDVAEAFNFYTQKMIEFGATDTELKAFLTDQLAKIPSGSFAHRMALGATVGALKERSHPQYPFFAKQYVDTYRNNSFGEIGPLEFDMNKSATFTPGMAAPDLVGQTPEGGSLALSQLRGKYVLIDFWASWCGPCRRENPNVVANYNKYKDKGFEILGVSLDKSEDAWKKAIEADGLTWKHISDLKGWSSQHAQLYSVTSIPQTVLLDKEGKIVQRNLRGPMLTAKLEELFGE